MTLLHVGIELCYLFVRISFGSEEHAWMSRSELRRRNAQNEYELQQLRATVARLEAAPNRPKAKATMIPP